MPSLDNGTAAGPRLRWRPPRLSAPTVVEMPYEGSFTRLDPHRDYIVKFPSSTKVGATDIQGGHNVVIIGGSQSVEPGSRSSGALRIFNATGTVHIEGLRIDNSASYATDGITIKAPRAVVQLQNVRIIGITGAYGGPHADLLQLWGGVKRLRIDRLSGTTNYQGLFLRPDLGAIGGMDLRNVDLRYDNRGASEGGHLVWLSTRCRMAPTTLRNVWLGPSLRRGRTLGYSVWPQADDRNGCPASVRGRTVRWPRLPVDGFVRFGRPPGGEFVPEGLAGPHYTSPGYEP
jgi:hypothetical protein